MSKEDDAYFGVCPICKRNDGFLNLAREHWFACHQHKLRWCWGANLISCWRDETEEDWQRNWERIGSYVECKPFHPTIGED